MALQTSMSIMKTEIMKEISNKVNTSNQEITDALYSNFFICIASYCCCGLPINYMSKKYLINLKVNFFSDFQRILLLKYKIMQPSRCIDGHHQNIL